jgi:hypothetical protein
MKTSKKWQIINNKQQGPSKGTSNAKDVRTLYKIYIFIFGQHEVPRGTKGTKYDIKDHSGVKK